LIDELTGHLQKELPFKLTDTAFSLAYKVTGVNDGSAPASKQAAAKASASGPNKNPLFVAGAVVGLSVACGLCHGAQYSTGSIFDGSLWTSVTNTDKPLHATFWPFSLMLTLHVINSAKSNGGYWAADIVSCTFTAFGGLMMKDLLDGNYTMPCLFADNESLISLLMVCWYFVNHDIPFTGINAWTLFSSNVNALFPLDAIMSLCSLAFNSHILINAAMDAGTSGNNFYHLPALGAVVFRCVALHCSNDFFNTDGLSFNVGESCSAACERATWIACWCGTNALANLPVIGTVFPLIGVVTSGIEGIFGGRANFLMAMILLEAIAGHLSKHKRPHTVCADFLYNFTGVSAN